MDKAKEPVIVGNGREKYDELVRVVDVINNRIREYGTEVKFPNYTLIEFKNAVNAFMPDYICSSVYLSKNDKEFFGMYISRKLGISNLVQIEDLRDINEKWNDSYSIDLDIKLFNIGLTCTEITALIVYDLYYILSSEATRSVPIAIDAISAGRRITMRDSLLNYLPIVNLLKFCACDYLYRSLSIFAHNENELVRVPDLIQACDSRSNLESACEKMFKVSNANGRLNVHPALSLNWVISMALNYIPGGTAALDVVNDIIDTTGSTVICNTLKQVRQQFLEIQTKTLNKLGNVHEASLFTKIRKSGLKSLENDLFEYEMRVKNVDDENSAIFLMRQINSRMGIISDYLDEESISDRERKRWEQIYDRYDKLRTKMTSKPIYAKKIYGLYTDYNALMQPGADNMITMNTMY